MPGALTASVEQSHVLSLFLLACQSSLEHEDIAAEIVHGKPSVMSGLTEVQVPLVVFCFHCFRGLSSHSHKTCLRKNSITKTISNTDDGITIHVIFCATC